MAFVRPYTVGDLIRRVRRRVHDVYNERYSDESIIDAVNDGLRAFSNTRADLFMFSSFSHKQIREPFDEIDAPDIIHNALVEYVSGTLLMQEGEAEQLQRAGTYLQRSAAMLNRIPSNS